MSINTSDSNDIEIVRRVLGGEINAFEALLKKYEAHVSRTVKRHIPLNQVEEICQEVFIKAYRSLPVLRNQGGFKQWISTIAVRTCYDFWRKEYRSREVPLSAVSRDNEDQMERLLYDQSKKRYGEDCSRGEARELLDHALNRLSAKERMVVELVYLEGLSGKEAADLLGWTVANVKIRTFRSRKKLHKILTDLTKA